MSIQSIAGSERTSSAQVVNLAPGYRFAHHYRIVKLIGSGGMGAVYECTHLETNRRRAVKILLPHLVNSDAHRERFQREALINARSESDFIVDVLDAGVDDVTGFPYLVMELLRGEDLSRLLRRTGPLPASDVVTFLNQVALALDRCHRASIVHRDLKPANLFLMRRQDGVPHVKVLDFGIAKVLEADTSENTHDLGTPTYMAPEQLDGSRSVTAATDIYALGMVAYTLLTGVGYWHEETRTKGPFALAALARNGPPEPATVRATRQGVVLPRDFDGWFARATAVEPKCRFARVLEAVDALAQALATRAPQRDVGPTGQSQAPLEPPLSARPNLASSPTSTSTATAPTGERGGRRRGRDVWGAWLMLGSTVLGLAVAAAAGAPTLQARDQITTTSHQASAGAGPTPVAPAESPKQPPAVAPPARPAVSSPPPVVIRRSGGSLPRGSAIQTRRVESLPTASSTPKSRAVRDDDPLERWGDCPHPGPDGTCASDNPATNGAR